MDPHRKSRKALESALRDPDEVVRKTAKISLDIHRNPRERWEGILSVRDSVQNAQTFLAKGWSLR